MERHKSVLIVVESETSKDPRVLRQISWLSDAGWTVDSVGLGELDDDRVRNHFTLGATPAWMLSRVGTLALFGFQSRRKRFERLTLSRFPDAVRARVRGGQYDLILFNDRHFVPWVTITKDFTPAALAGHLHLDLHEYFVPTLKRDSLWRLATAAYYEWSRGLFAHPAFTTRSTVNSGIAELYERELGIPTPSIVRNCPPFEDQQPGAVDPTEIRLIHHGAARGDRGIRQMIEAMRLCGSRFTLTLMLVGGEGDLAELREFASDVADRVSIVPPVPVDSLAREINAFDLEVMFYEPTTKNLELALPNKLFEAVQGRLGIVIGESPEMAKLVDEHGNGIVVAGWAAADLAAALDSLTADDVQKFKQASHRAAPSLSAEHERNQFFADVDSSSLGTST